MRFVIDNTGSVESAPIVFPPFASGQPADWEAGVDFVPYSPEGYVTLQALPTEIDTLNGSTTTITYDSLSRLAKVRDSSKAWAVDQFRGKWLVGSGYFDLAAIAGNTTDTLDTTASDHFPPFTGPLRIVDAGADLQGSVILSGIRAPISFNGQRITQPGLNGITLLVDQCQEFDTALCDLMFPSIATDFSYVRAYIHGNGGFADVYFSSNWGVLFQSYIADCWPYTSIGFTEVAGILENCHMPFGGSLSGEFALCECRKTPFVLGAGDVSALWLKVDDVPGDAVIANAPCALDLYAVGTGPTVPGFGLRASNGAQVHVHDNVNPTGGSGDLIVGQKPKRTWLDFRTNPVNTKNEIDQTSGTGDGSRVWE
jgi:hypothetical protein